MPIGYLVTVALVGGCTLLAVAPLRRPQAVGAMSWRLALVINELSFLAFYWLLTATVLAVVQGDVDSLADWAVVAAAVLTTLGLVIIARRGLRAPRWRTPCRPDWGQVGAPASTRSSASPLVR